MGMKMDDQEILDLMSKMTLREKIGQMTQKACFSSEGEEAEAIKEAIRKGDVGSMILAETQTGGNDADKSGGTPSAFRDELQKIAVEESPHGIPVLFGRDVIHGHRTVFPSSLGMAAMFDPDLVREGYRLIAKEAVNDGNDWTFSPMLDISRDPRWGRAVEGIGEDPYVGELQAKAVVEGFQGKDGEMPEDALPACAKHYIGYGAMDAGRDYGTCEISDYTLRNFYLRPFKAAIEAGLNTVMTSFNTLNGTSPTLSKYLVTDILKEELGMEGFVVTDWDSVTQLQNQGLAADRKEAAMLSANAGVDMDMVCDCFLDHLEELVAAGEVSMETVDEACYRILWFKKKWGFFKTPFTRKVEYSVEDHDKVAKKASDECMVLLKNNGVLPLNKDQQVVLCGPFVHEKRSLLGNWTLDGDVSRTPSMKEAMEKKSENVFTAASPYLWDEQLSAMIGKDVIVACMGESYLMSGEANSLTEIELPQEQVAYVQRLKRYGKPVVGVLSYGRALALENVLPYLDAVLVCWQGGTKTAESVADALYGDVNPSGKLPMTFPRSTGQVPIYYNYIPGGRRRNFYYDAEDYGAAPYHDRQCTPLFPFGFGLSYTEFSYTGLSVDETELALSDVENGKNFTVRVKVKNTGAVEGTEVVQLYVGDVAASMARPVKELKGFKRVTLLPGEEKEVVFEITNDSLSFYHEDKTLYAEKGVFKLFAGGSAYTALETEIRLV